MERVYTKADAGTLLLAVINISIVRPPRTAIVIYFFYPDGDSPCLCLWLRNGYWKDLARQNTVRNRDRDKADRNISGHIYIVQCSENNTRGL